MLNMSIAFLTEMGFTGKVSVDHLNMRTEFAWMHALNADHFNIYSYSDVQNYEHVFIIFPKGRVYLDACGTRISEQENPISNLLSINIANKLKACNKRVYYVQEGPHWLHNDYELVDQINFYNMLATCDAIFAHNSSDVRYYKGLYPALPVHVMPTLMIESKLKNIIAVPEDKAIVGGNFARWYGGFESYVVAQEFGVPIWGQTSHAMRSGENQLIQHLPRLTWVDWMRELSAFRYAVHLMPTVAAGTFSLNCAYFGIPCIGNIDVDTQRLCHPELAVDVSDVHEARKLASRLKNDSSFYASCSNHAKHFYKKYFTQDLFVEQINSMLGI